MKKGLVRLTALALMATTIVSADVKAQEGQGTVRSKNGGEEITILRKSDSTEKMIIVVDGDKIMVNGKLVDENDGDITVNRRKVRDVSAFSFGPNTRYTVTSDARPNSAVLGVTSSAAEKGIKLLSVTKESGADKAGLKKDDVITKIDNDEVSTPDALTKKIRSHKPGDKVDVTYLRNGKSQKVTAELGKMDEVVVTGFGSMGDFDMKFDNDAFNGMNEIQLDRIPRVYGQTFGALSGAPRLGLTVQDTDDGKGVKVLNVSDEGNAEKAGIEEDDIILEVDGKAVNSADEIARIMKDSKDKISVKFKYERDGKTNTIDVKVPRKLKTANL
ncbi:MAG: PDZ domain-containing protein [Chitinophagaceae bacterium]|nr:MAG: PDZ domain-containing protein [Chitinophagaceae bacterium]